jgi:hypothetical protein
MLIHTISVESQSTMKVNIHNQCSDFKLMGQGCFSNGAGWNECHPRIDTGDITSINLTPFLSTFGGVVTYRLERKYVEPDNLPKPTHIQLFVAWKSEGYKKFCIFMQLVECNKRIDWNRIKLEEYYQRYANQFSTYTGPINDKWLISDGTVLMTGLELDFTQRDGVLNITISEGVEDGHTKRPKWINLEK